MGVVDEKDYIMRMIKEMVQVLFSLVFGKKYVSVELEDENKYEVSGNTLKGHTVGCRICSVRLSEVRKTFCRK